MTFYGDNFDVYCGDEFGVQISYTLTWLNGQYIFSYMSFIFQEGKIFQTVVNYTEKRSSSLNSLIRYKAHSWNMRPTCIIYVENLISACGITFLVA